VLGTAYALNLLLGIPLFWGVIITAFDTLLFLLLQYASIRLLEMVIGGFLMVVSGCFIIEMFFVTLNPLDMIEGFVPFLHVTEGEFGLGGYATAAIGLLGAVVMPHNLFLHSALVKTRDVERSILGIKEAMIYNIVECALALFVSFVINFCIISVSASQFYPSDTAGLDQAADLLSALGPAAPIIFGIALLASGQSSTITGTYAGQFVMEVRHIE
jgi:NRAMP (natural resistance-associated macrophage protein)-like metal ion transporter